MQTNKIQKVFVAQLVFENKEKMANYIRNAFVNVENKFPKILVAGAGRVEQEQLISVNSGA